MTWPGWNSLDSVRRYAGFFEIAGLVALALLVVFEVLNIPEFFALAPLVVFEVLAYLYGQQRDALNEDYHQAVVANLVSELAKSSNKITTIEAQQYPRHLTADQRDQIASKLKPFAGNRISLLGVGGPEAGAFGEQILKTVRQAGWYIGALSLYKTGESRKGLVFAVPDPDSLTPAQNALVAAFNEAGHKVSLAIGPDILYVGIRVPESHVA